MARVKVKKQTKNIIHAFWKITNLKTRQQHRWDAPIFLSQRSQDELVQIGPTAFPNSRQQRELNVNKIGSLFQINLKIMMKFPKP